MAQMRPATACIGNDGVKTFRWDEIHQSFCDGDGQKRFAVMRVQRSAAGLFRGGIDAAAIGQKDVSGVPVNIREDKVLHASCEKGNFVAGRLGRLIRLDELVGKGRRNLGGLWFEAAQVFWKKTHEAATAEQFLYAAFLINTQHSPRHSEQPGVQEEDL